MTSLAIAAECMWLEQQYSQAKPCAGGQKNVEEMSLFS